MSLYIYTKKPNNIFSIEFIKEIARLILFKKRGPQMVNGNLIKGLKYLNYSYFLNKQKKGFKKNDVIFVNSSVQALKWLINMKKKCKFKKLILGPNIFAKPNDYNNLIIDKDIDIILLPSIWNKEMFSKYIPNIKNKFKIWPSGVDVPKEISVHKNIDFLIYFKNNDNLLKNIIEYLNNKNYIYKIVKYGSYSRKKYFKLINESKYLIFLSNSETQGIALFESWVRDVPTFIWDRGYWKNDKYIFYSDKISCPYLNKENGMTFNNFNDFILKLDSFTKNQYFSRTFIINNFTNEKAAKNFLQFIE